MDSIWLFVSRLVVVFGLLVVIWWISGLVSGDRLMLLNSWVLGV